MTSTPSHWQRRGAGAIALLPLSLLFAAVVAVRRRLFALGLLRRERLPVPVIVVGNVTAGGTGKTPFVLWLVDRLLEAGWRPGIVTRGYGGRGPEPSAVLATSDPRESGDEAVLMARHGRCPVWRGRDRAAAGRALLAAHPDCDVVVSDDGLQHYRLGRDLEIALVDGMRGTGNGLPLPSGPLREPRSRLRDCDFVVVKEPASADAGLPAGAWRMQLVPGPLERLGTPGETVPLASFAGRTVHAVAGIGSPESFFGLLERTGIRVVRHALPDHHAFSADDLRFPEPLPVVMTEKDAVKCAHLTPLPSEAWSLPVQARIDGALFDSILASLRHGHRSETP